MAYEWLLLPLLICQAVFSFVPLYAGYGALAFAVIYFGPNAKGIIRIAFLSIPVEYISLLLGELLASHGIESLMGALVSALTVGLALWAIYVFVTMYARKKNTYIKEVNFLLKNRCKSGDGIFVDALIYDNINENKYIDEANRMVVRLLMPLMVFLDNIGINPVLLKRFVRTKY